MKRRRRREIIRLIREWTERFGQPPPVLAPPEVMREILQRDALKRPSADAGG